MARKRKVRLLVSAEAIKEICHGRTTMTDWAAKCGISKQALNNWLADGAVTPGMLVELLRDAKLSREELEEILAPQFYRKKFKMTITLEDP